MQGPTAENIDIRPVLSPAFNDRVTIWIRNRTASTTAHIQQEQNEVFETFADMERPAHERGMKIIEALFSQHLDVARPNLVVVRLNRTKVAHVVLVTSICREAIFN